MEVGLLAPSWSFFLFREPLPALEEVSRSDGKQGDDGDTQPAVHDFDCTRVQRTGPALPARSRARISRSSFRSSIRSSKMRNRAC